MTERKRFGVPHGAGWTMATALVMLLASCSAEPIVPKCSHRNAVSMGAENDFRVSILSEGGVKLEDNDDRIDVAMTIVPPIVGPVTLVQQVEGREPVRWDLELIPGTSISTRCRLGATPDLSTCKAAIGALPMATAGNWSIEPRGNHVLEAALAFRTCR